MGSRLRGLSKTVLEVSAHDPDEGDVFSTLELFGPDQVLLDSVACAPIWLYP